jgi:hypothetical protein
MDIPNLPGYRPNHHRAARSTSIPLNLPLPPPPSSPRASESVPSRSFVHKSTSQAASDLVAAAHALSQAHRQAASLPQNRVNSQTIKTPLSSTQPPRPGSWSAREPIQRGKFEAWASAKPAVSAPPPPPVPPTVARPVTNIAAAASADIMAASSSSSSTDQPLSEAAAMFAQAGVRGALGAASAIAAAGGRRKATYAGPGAGGVQPNWHVAALDALR